MGFFGWLVWFGFGFCDGCFSFFACFLRGGKDFFFSFFLFLRHPEHRMILLFFSPGYLGRFLFQAVSQGNMPKKMEIPEDSELVGW